ncbi:hypothetical protein [uncultured Ruegeria sp.]|uniref:hypothetical protein n=1 Tax=uncultured Ruegeria sp. TaxID=259304 RepID=UPI00260C60A0|nr:hypothetical protein [uncultured Ruegeria sp.]
MENKKTEISGEIEKIGSVVQSTSTDPLVGRCFVIFGNEGIWNYQGHIVGALDGGHYLIQFFEAAFGMPSTLAIFHITEMKWQMGRPKGSWEFFEDDQHLRDWIDRRHGHAS